MRLLRVGIAWILVFGLSSATFAGDLRESIANAAQQQAQTPPAGTPVKISPAYLWPGTVLFVGGMTMAVYGFLHTSGGEFVSGEVSKESKTSLGGAGLAVAGLGGALLFFGSQRAKHTTSISVAPGRLALSKQISW